LREKGGGEECFGGEGLFQKSMFDRRKLGRDVSDKRQGRELKRLRPYQ